MLKKINRLKKRKEFGYIYKHGNVKYSKNLKLYQIQSKNKNVRIGLSVNNKIGNAVCRNKIKRQLRAILKDFIPFVKSKNNLIFVVKESIIELDFNSIRNEVIYLLKKAELLENFNE